MESTTIYIDPVEVDDADATAQVSSTLGGQKSDYLEAIVFEHAVRGGEGEGRRGGDARERVRELASGGSAKAWTSASAIRRCGSEYPNAQVEARSSAAR
ncbi:MAG: hypothetical protein ACLT98_14485 [Eggerthellaceae bacterium]